MRVVELKDGTLSAYLATVEQQPGALRNVFRGQQDATWSLQPGLYRIENTNIHSSTVQESYDFFEAQMVSKFFEQGLPYLPAIQRGFTNDRILAQHFGVPTRFLDWSLDPLVALYFATENPRSDTDAAIFMLAPDAVFNSENFDRVRGSLPRYTAASISPPAIDRRIPAQKSIFTVHPYGDSTSRFVPLDSRPTLGGIYMTGTVQKQGFSKIIIPQRLKYNFRHLLHGMGVDQRNLFPGLEGVGADIARRAHAGLLSF